MDGCMYEDADHDELLHAFGTARIVDDACEDEPERASVTRHCLPAPIGSTPPSRSRSVSAVTPSSCVASSKGSPAGSTVGSGACVSPSVDSPLSAPPVREPHPAPAASALADVCVIHGGQGTVQTAVASGKPIVGVALQIEQQTNLDNVMNAKAGIRVQRQFWKANNIRNAVQTVLKDTSYTANARILGETLRNMDGAKTAAEVMWKFILEEQSEKMKV